MINMEIESENDVPACPPYPASGSPYLSAHAYPPSAALLRRQSTPHTLSLDEARILKKKQENNILSKIQKIVQKVTPIHEADYESDNENDMHDLIEGLEKMDVE